MMRIKVGGVFQAMVDDKDLKTVSAFKWFPETRQKKTGPYTYAVTRVKKSDGRLVQYRMHRIVFGDVPKGFVVFHKDGNGLNNIRENLGLKKDGGSVLHGHAFRGKTSRTYTIWVGMIKRCLDKNQPNYKNYGGRGIMVCDRWKKFENFLADMGTAPDGLELDRIDNESGYSHSNCRWVSHAENLRNQRRSFLISINGTTRTITEWSRLSGISINGIRTRLLRGVEPCMAVFGKRAESYLKGKKLLNAAGDDWDAEDLAETVGDEDLPDGDCDDDTGDGVDYDEEPDTVTEATVE